MNIRQAKDRITIPDFLARIDHQPAYVKNGEHWYHSPLPGREDNTPSFKTNRTGRLWFDQGTRKGGTVIELAMQMFDCDESGALEHLTRLYPGDLFDTPPQVVAAGKRQTNSQALPLFEHRAQAENGKEYERTDIEVIPITSRGLYWYLHDRGIDPRFAKPYVQEMRYQVNGKPFYALAFASDAEGSYELRNVHYQGTHGPKTIRVLHPEKASEGGSVTVFEGFFDFLSALAYYGKAEPDTPVIVMNSAALHAQTAEAIQRMGAARAFLYLDHDKTGREAAQSVREALPDVILEDRSGLYSDYKDFNEFWKEQRKRIKASAHHAGA